VAQRVTAPDVAIVGGGIVGTATAWFLAEAGARVRLLEATTIAAGASGRNSGSIQHPFDDVLAALHLETLDLYRRVSAADAGFRLPDAPAGLLLVSRDRVRGQALCEAVAAGRPELRPSFIDVPELERLEPSLAPGLVACRLETGYPVRPSSATQAFATLARRAGATIETNATARIVRDGRLAVEAAGRRHTAGFVVVAAGPSTPDIIDPGDRWPPIRRTWGVTAEVALAKPPRGVIEEIGAESVGAGVVASIFSIVTADGRSVVGSTFLEREPDAAAIAPVLVERGASFVPSLRGVAIQQVRLCARPQSRDGRPLVGAVPGIDGLFVAAGHGPWGISTGPATARMIADLVLGRDARIPAALDPARFREPPRIATAR
jgi:glycine/D-amino acid oxidase-like deaminating enzyme